MVEESKMATILDANGVAVNPETGNPDHRTTPIHSFKRAYARGGMVVIVGMVGSEEVEREINRSEAITRAKAVNDMIPKLEYSSDKKLYHFMVESIMAAIIKAKEDDGGKYTSSSVSMHGTALSSDPRVPVGKESAESAPAASAPAKKLKVVDHN